MSGKLIRYFLLIALMLAPLARADAITIYESGNRLLDICQGAESVQIVDCAGYIKGVADQLESARSMGEKAGCIPPGISVGRLLEISVTYLRAHPEKREESGASLVATALTDEWKCQ
jgi:hypothetical protein